MVEIYVYDRKADDTSTTGLVGVLTPISCKHEEIGNGLSCVTMVHPYDEWGKWRALVNDNRLSVPVRARTVPKIDPSGRYVTSVEKWTVRTSATQAQLAVYVKDKKTKKKGTLIAGRTVIVLEKGKERYQVQYEKHNKRKNKYTWLTGWVAFDALDYDTTETIQDSASGIEVLCPSGEARPQLFTIKSVERDVEKQEIVVYAVHISYELSTMLTLYKNDAPLDAVTALTGIMAGIGSGGDFEAHTDLANTRTSCDWTDVTATEALLNPDTGFAKRWGGELIRDDYDLYFLANGGTNRGIRIEHRKNLMGATMEVSWEDLVTSIKPRGVKMDGDPLYLTDDANGPSNYVVSPNTAIYGTRATVLDCEDCTVEKGKKGVTLAVARKRMREQAQARFDTEKVDEPRITLKVSFVELGKTAEYEKYKPLENVYLWDDIVIAAKDYGIEAQAKVTKMVYDVLNDMVTEVELGDIDRTGKIYKWQVPAITGGMLSPGLRDNETPLITLSGGSFVVVADQNGICDAAVASYSILAWRGYTPVSPVLGAITGVPEGMTLTLGTIVNTGMLPLTLSVSKGATLGRVEQCAGQISIETIQPVATTLAISWAKVCKGDDGADGSIRQFVFKLMANDAVPTIDQNPNSMMEYIPQGWTDSPGGISESHPYEWMSYRDRLNGTWTGFGMPTIWAHWGVRGRDGDGVEYVYKLTGTDIAPGIETSSNQKDGYVPGGWTVDPSGVTRANPYEWVSTRRKTSGIWGAFSTPALWAKYGSDGDTIEYIYAKSVAESAPSLNAGGVNYNQIAVQEKNVVPFGWSANPVGVTDTYPFEWISKRDCINGEWTAFSWPALYSRYATDGSGAYLSPSTIMFEGSSSGTVSARSVTVYVCGTRGNLSVVPMVQPPTALPSGVSYSIGNADEQKRVPVTLTVAGGSTLGSTGSATGLIYFPITSPVETTLGLPWAKINSGPQGAIGSDGADGSTTYRQSTMPTNAVAGDLWVNTADSTIRRYDGSAWANVFLNASYITAGSIATNLLTSTVITAINLSAGTISADRVETQTITAEMINALNVRAYQLLDRDVNSNAYGFLSSLSADGGPGFGLCLNDGYGTKGAFMVGYTDYGDIVSIQSAPEKNASIFSEYFGFRLSVAPSGSSLLTNEGHSAYGKAVITIPLPGRTVVKQTGYYGEEAVEVYRNNSNNNVVIALNGNVRYSGTLSAQSDRRKKRDIAALDGAWLLKQLRPVRYRKVNGDGAMRFGLIAQEVQAALKSTDFDGSALVDDSVPDNLALAYEELIAVLIEGWQKHEQIITEQQSQINQLQARIARLEELANA